MENSQDNLSEADKHADRPNQKKYRRYKAKQPGLKETGEKLDTQTRQFNIVDNDNDTTCEELQLDHG